MNEEKKRLEKVAEDFSTYEGFNGKIICYTAKYMVEYCKGPSILEMGSADGLISGFLAKRFDEVIAVDGSETLIKKARERYRDRKNLTFVQSFFEELSLKRTFNTVWQTHILEHVENPVAILAKGREHLAEDGVLIAEVPNANSIHRLIGVQMGIIDSLTSLSESDMKLGHRRVYTLEKLKHDVGDAGLKVVKSGGYLLKPLSNNKMEGWNNDLLEAFFELGKKIPEYAAEIYVVCKKA